MNLIGNKISLNQMIKIFFYISLSVYMLTFAYTHPYLGIKLENVNNSWHFSKDNKADIYASWLQKNHIKYEDEIMLVNGQRLNHSSPYLKNDELMTASTLILKDNEGDFYSAKLQPFDILYWSLFTVIVPTFYAVFSLILSLYLMFKKKEIPLMDYLINFLLSTSLAYTSSHLSSLGNILGSILISSFMVLSLAILCNFLIHYINLIKKKNYSTLWTRLLYTLSLIPLVMNVVPSLKRDEPSVTLTIFLILIVCLITITFYGMFYLKIRPMYYMFIGMLLPFAPFVFFYILPYLLNKKDILNPEYCVVFLLLIPFNIIALHIVEQLFNLTYYIARIMYYSWISLFFVIWIVLGTSVFIKLAFFKVALFSIFIYFSTMIFLYLKEHLDFKNRSVLFTMKGNHMHDLYKNIRILSKSYTLEQSLQNVKQVVEKYLHINDVTIRQTDTSCEEGHLVIGKMIIEKEKYTSLIHCEHSNSLYIDIPKKSIHLQNEQIVWLELFYSYVDNFLTSTKIIEELMEQLQKVSTKNDFLPNWLKKLIYIRVDEEKYKVAQELHDTILQKYYHIARQLNMVVSSQPELNSIYQQFIESITNLRTYCETLKPPLLAKQGLQPALEQLARKMALESEFDLDYSFDRLYLENEDLPLTIYRIIQELLNNAQKHACATKIVIHLEELENECMIHYEDNGVGFDIEQVKKGETFGLQGIQERVEAFNGSFDIMTKRSEGVKVHIVFEEEFIKND